MDKQFEELCFACRIGDLPNVDRLIVAGVNLNAVDKFDNSPLFLASLCGHEEVVRLLLKSGTICDRDRYEGARCIYGALTDSIRDLLLTYDISKAINMNQPFATHISSLLNKDSNFGTFDVILQKFTDRVSGSLISKYKGNENIGDSLFSIKAHRYMIQARCPKFFDVICKQQLNDSVMKIRDDIPIYALKFLLKFIYLIPVLHTIKHTYYHVLIEIASILELEDLLDFLNKVKYVTDPSEKSALMLKYQYIFTSSAKKQLSNFVKCHIIHNAILIPNELTPELLRHLISCSALPDILIRIKDNNGIQKIYPCHLSILIRSDYFRGMFIDPFEEFTSYFTSKNNNIYPDLNMQILDIPAYDPDIFEMVLRYLYYDESNLPWNYALGVISLSDFLLIDRLKSIAITVIIQSQEILEQYSIFAILYFAWSNRLERLEQYVAKMVADNLKNFCQKKEFKQAIVKSSERIVERQKTDTIEFVDDIRYFLLKKYNLEPENHQFVEEGACNGSMITESEYSEYMNDITLINNILDDLGLYA